MIFSWFRIFNLEDFPEELVSKTFTVNLSGINNGAGGLVDILVSRGIQIVILYDGVVLPLLFEDKNPFIGLGNQYAVYQDEDDFVYLGFRVEEE